MIAMMCVCVVVGWFYTWNVSCHLFLLLVNNDNVVTRRFRVHNLLLLIHYCDYLS